MKKSTRANQQSTKKSTRASQQSVKTTRRPQLWLTLGGGLGILVLITVSWSTLFSQGTTAPTHAAEVQVARADTAPAAGSDAFAPDFTVTTLKGGTFTLSGHRGKPVILFTMAYWCGTCIPEAKVLGKLHQEYGDKLIILALDVDPSSTPELLQKFRRHAGEPDYVWAFDKGNRVATAYRVRALDTTFIMNKTGQIVYKDTYPSSYKTLKAQIKKLLG